MKDKVTLKLAWEGKGFDNLKKKWQKRKRFDSPGSGLTGQLWRQRLVDVMQGIDVHRE